MQILIFIMQLLTNELADSSIFKSHLLESAPHLRLFIMGLVLLITLTFKPKGIQPEKIRHV